MKARPRYQACWTTWRATPGRQQPLRPPPPTLTATTATTRRECASCLRTRPPPRPRRRRDLANSSAVTAAASTDTSSSSAAADVVGLLVSIFGGADVLASEYRALLAARLLSVPRGFDADAHVRTLELLRARFGDAGLHGAEVMLKDVADSRRAQRAAVAALPPGAAPASPPRGGGKDATITLADGTAVGGAGGVGRLSALITSAVFWPPLLGGGGRGAHTTTTTSSRPPFKLPASVHAWMESYAARYYVLKAPRRLVWAPAAGVATLTVRVGGKARTFTATPLEAAVLCAVAEGGSDRDWSVNDVAAAVESTDADAARALARWVGTGVLIDRGGGAYGRATALPARGAAGGVAVPPGAGDDEDASGGGGAAAAAAVAAADAVASNFILGMLTNFEAGLPPDRVHTMLKMFATDPPYDKRCERERGGGEGWWACRVRVVFIISLPSHSPPHSLDQLIALLDRMVADEKLALEGSVYRKR